MANGFYILYSGDPHLAAVGFVWEPLQSIADMVVLLGNHLWPALSHNDMAGSLVSALAMAGAAFQMCAALREWGVTRAPRLVLTAFFALNPMILYYGGNGMSEALYLFTLITSTRYLLRWMRCGDLRSLAYSAVALGFCYLTRNEAALAALLGGLAVGVVSYSRAQGRRVSRLRTGLSDLAIFGVPAFTAAVGWAIRQLRDHRTFLMEELCPCALHTNGYSSHDTLHDRVLYQVHAIGALAPFLPILLVVAAVAGGHEERSPDPGACGRARRRAGLRHVVVPGATLSTVPSGTGSLSFRSASCSWVAGGGGTDASPSSGPRTGPKPIVTLWRPRPGRHGCSRPGAGGHDPDHPVHQVRHVKS